MEESVKHHYTINEITENKILSKTIQKVNIEYCNSGNINYFINNKKKNNALFQKFVYPFSNKHNIFEVYWNDHIISVSKKTNSHYLNDKVSHIGEKLYTVEEDGAQYVNSKNMANARITKKLKELCEEIRDKINFIYFYREYTVIKGMEFRRESDYDILKGKQILKSFKFNAKMDDSFNFIIMYFMNLEFKLLFCVNLNAFS